MILSATARLGMLRNHLHTGGAQGLSSLVIYAQLCTNWSCPGCTDGATLQKKQMNRKRVTLFKLIFRLDTFFFFFFPPGAIS